MEDIGVAKGYIELDISKMSSAASQATKELKQIDRQGALTQSELNKLEAVSKGTGNMFQQMAQRSKTLTAQINEGNQKVAAYQKGIANLNTVVKTSQREQQALGEKITQAKDKLAQSEEKVKSLADAHKAAQQAISAAAATYKKDSEEYQKVVEANQDAITAYEKATQAVREQENGLTQLEVKYQSLGAQIDESRNQIVDYETAVNNTEAAISKMRDELAMTSTKLITVGDAIEQAGGKIQLVGGKLSSAGNALTAGVTTPIIGAGTAATKFAMDAETSYAKVSTIIDDTVVSYDDLKKGVVAASNESGVAVTDFNEALYSAVSAGVDSGSAIQFTTDMVKLAKGGFTDTAKSVDVVTTVLNAYGLEASQATAISDKLITTQNLGKTTVDELASSMGKVIPTAKAVNVDMDNVSASMATLTKNGIATAEAATYYNSMLNELGKSGSVADKALRKLTKKGFAELIASGVPMTEILGKLDDYAKKSGKSLSDMFGSAEASKAALTIMKGDGVEYNEILTAMKDSAGATQAAFEKMDATPAAKMQKELNKLKNAAISVGEKLLPLATKAMDAIGDLVDKFNELTPAQKKSALQFAGIAAAAGPVLKIVGTTTTGLGKLTKGFGSLVKAMGLTSAAKKASSGLDGVTKAAEGSDVAVGGMSKTLSKLASPGGIAVLATGAVLALGAAILKMRDDAVKADIEKHFGKIKLSAEEVEDVAKRITETDWTVKMDAYLEAKSKLDEFEKEIEESVATIEKLNWKVSVGLELTEGEKGEYKSAVENYIKSTNAYIEQQRYTVNLAIDFVFEGNATGQRLSEFSDTFYSQAQGELDVLGEKLADLMNKAFEENAFDKYAPDIQKMQKQYSEKMKEITDMEYRADLSNFKVGLSAEGIQLDKESFDNLNKKIGDEVEKTGENLKEYRKSVIMMIEAEYQANIDSGMKSDAAQKIYDDAIQELEAELSTKNSEVALQGIDFSFSELEKSYGTEINDTLGRLTTKTGEFADRIVDGQRGVFDAMYAEFSTSPERFGQLYGDAEKVMKDYFEALTPRQEQIETAVQKCREAGMLPPESLREGFNTMAQSGALVGDVDSMYYVMGQQIASSQEYMDAIAAAKRNGENVPEQVMDSIYVNSGKVFNSTTGMWEQVTSATEDASAIVAADLNERGAEQGDELAEGLAARNGVVFDSAKGLWVSISEAMEEGSSGYGPSDQYGAKVPDGMAASITEGAPKVSGAVTDMNAMTASVLNDDTQVPEAAKSSGGKVSTGYTEGLNAGKEASMSIFDQYFADHKDAIIQADVPGAAYEDAAKASQRYGDGWAANMSYAQGQADKVLGAVDSTVSADANSGKWSGYGKTPVSNFAGGMYSVRGSARDQALWIADEMDSALSSFPSETWGKHLVGGFVSGINSLVDNVSIAARSVAQAASQYLHFTRPDKGPLRDYESWMPHFIQGLAKSLRGNSDVLSNAASYVASQMQIAFDTPKFGNLLDFDAFSSPNWRGTLRVQNDDMIDYGRLAAALAGELRANPIMIENHLDNTTVVDLDSEVIARKTEPKISRIMARKTKLQDS